MSLSNSPSIAVPQNGDIQPGQEQGNLGQNTMPTFRAVRLGQNPTGRSDETTFLSSFTSEVSVTSTSNGKVFTTSSPTVITTVIVTTKPSSSATSSTASNPLKGGIIAGAVIGSIAFVSLLALAVWYILRLRKRRNATRTSSLEDTLAVGRPITTFNAGPTPAIDKSIEAGFHDSESSYSRSLHRQQSVEDRVSLLRRAMSDIQSQRTSLLSRHASQPQNHQDNGAGTVELVRQQAEQLAALQRQVEQLSALLNTPWAHGIDEAPPPEYEEIAAGIETRRSSGSNVTRI